jgi:hypothetical protein
MSETFFMNRSALLEQVKQDRKDSIKMLEGDRLRVRFQPKPTLDQTRVSATIFKQFILDTEAYPLN